MIDYAVKIQGDQRVALRFDTFPDEARDALAEKITQLTAELLGAVQDAIPRGKTGALAGQVRSGVEIQQNRVRGWVSLAGADANAVKKAAALEYGSRGTKFAVSSYRRTMDQVFGRATAPFDQVVAAYRRAGGLQAMDFLHGPLDASAAGALAEMQAAVDAAIKDAE